MPQTVVTIESLAFGGNGVCRVDGKVCFVPFSCPGDRVTLHHEQHKKSYSTACIDTLVEPSPMRVSPVCALFGVCGGCNWQHISYEAQQQHKHSIFAQTLWRGARIPVERVEPLVAAPGEYGYRSRLQFKVSVRNSRLNVGFFRHNSHQVIAVENGCPVAAPLINETLLCFKEVLQAYPDRGDLSQLCLDEGISGVIAVFVQSSRITKRARQFLISHAHTLGSCSGIFVKVAGGDHVEKVWGDSGLSYQLPRVNAVESPLLLAYPPGGFAQVNRQQNRTLLEVVRRLARCRLTDTLLDLYCGNGNFSLPLAAEVASVTGVEGNPAAVAAARANSIDNVVANSEFFCDDTAAAVRKLVAAGRTFTLILLDPPRAGAADAVNDIVRMNPERVVYISCDPATLARDCALFIASGYDVLTSVPVDMFPQTYHLESVTLLCR